MEQQDIREMKVAGVLHEEWPTLGPDETVEAVIKLFAESGISGAPVVEDGRLIGIVTEGDLIFSDADIKAPGFLDILGGIIPLGKLGRISPGDAQERRHDRRRGDDEGGHHGPARHPARRGRHLMAEKSFKILPVAEGGELRGVMTRMDILTLHVLNPRR